jgi:hypothetical protein
VAAVGLITPVMSTSNVAWTATACPRVTEKTLDELGVQEEILPLDDDTITWQETLLAKAKVEGKVICTIFVEA